MRGPLLLKEKQNCKSNNIHVLDSVKNYTNNISSMAGK